MKFCFSYDISDSSRRNKISKILEKYGIRIQKSIFMCDISSIEGAEVKERLHNLFSEKEDSLLLFSACKDCLKKIIVLGNKNTINNDEYIIL